MLPNSSDDKITTLKPQQCSGAMAKSALASGAQLFTDCPVQKITTSVNGEANGVILESGQEIRSRSRAQPQA